MIYFYRNIVIESEQYSKDNNMYHNKISRKYIYTSILLFIAGIVIIIIYANAFSQFDNYAYLKEFEFGYGADAAKWQEYFPECGSDRQSPIDLHISSLKLDKLPKLQRNIGYAQVPLAIVLSISQRSIRIKPSYKSNRPAINGGPLNGTYLLEYIEFHWGSSNDIGSEHTINGKRFQMEVHAVHKYEQYQTMDEALMNGDGLAIVAYLFQIEEERSLTLDLVIKGLTNMPSDGLEDLELEEKFPMSFLLPEVYRNYGTYFGSLTKPPCSEAVTWIVNLTPISITSDQIAEFRQLYSTYDFLVDNYRPIQPMNGRLVYIAA